MIRNNRKQNLFLSSNNKPKYSSKQSIRINDANDFPSLLSNSNKKKNTAIDYKKMTQINEIPLSNKKEKTQIPTGHILVKNDKNKIIIEVDTKTSEKLKKVQETGYQEFVEKTHVNMVNRWQKERDDLNDLLGYESPYWDSISLFEFDEAELNAEISELEEEDEEDEDDDADFPTLNDEYY